MASSKSVRLPMVPSAVISTPDEVFETIPFIEYVWASLYIKGLNPTPCTIPFIFNRFALIWTLFSMTGVTPDYPLSRQYYVILQLFQGLLFHQLC